jgi:hypothetical protein
MAAVDTAPALPDACMVCHPGDAPVAFPSRVQRTAAGRLATYTCRLCGAIWHTLWHEDGWPADRRLEPVTPEQAARNLAGLEESLKQPRTAA